MEDIPKFSGGDHLIKPKRIFPEILNSLLHQGTGHPPALSWMKIGGGLRLVFMIFFSVFPSLSPSQGSGGSVPSAGV
ncbi:hypothetical protein J2129_001892 [Methanofollis sp. W23]|nr:hypothetical protein [Methanofollis sp. W23]